jgi:hypothetical protein
LPFFLSLKERRHGSGATKAGHNRSIVISIAALFHRCALEWLAGASGCACCIAIDPKWSPNGAALAVLWFCHGQIPAGSCGIYWQLALSA